jgi:hypothetical protein
LKIVPFKNALTNKSDDELVWLKAYLLAIANLDDFSGLKHRKWRQYLAKNM